MADSPRLYPMIDPYVAGDGPFLTAPPTVRWDDDREAGEVQRQMNDPVVDERDGPCGNTTIVNDDDVAPHSLDETITDLPPENDITDCLDKSMVENSDVTTGSSQRKSGRYFFYDTPFYEETGTWIPVSVPPMSESDHEEWHRGFGSNGGYFPEEELEWEQHDDQNKDMTMWDVVYEMLLAAKGKLTEVASYNVGRHGMALMSNLLLHEAWKDMAQTLVEANNSLVNEILESEPTKWLPDSVARACMLCGGRFHPIMCPRHHCRFCGGIFCGDCSKSRSLMPPKFRTAEPQRVCDVCCIRLENVQPYLMNQVSRASLTPAQDVMDLTTLRSWLNIPWSRTMEYEIYKAANTLKGYAQVGKLSPEKSIPEAIFRQAKGLAIITVVNVGVMMTYKVGTGLVVARRKDGSWSAPSAISTFGLGWGAQAGGEISDCIIILRNTAAINTFSGNAHLSVGGGISAAAGVLGRTAEADLRAGDGGIAACYTYSCSKGAFMGCALNGSMVSTRASENARFYGMPVKGSDILLGSMPKPPAAVTLYRELDGLFDKVGKQHYLGAPQGNACAAAPVH